VIRGSKTSRSIAIGPAPAATLPSAARMWTISIFGFPAPLHGAAEGED
jgi:hypothetical protein